MVASPCIGVCRIDPHSGYCAGCARTAVEIASWTSASDSQKLRILAKLPARREQLTAQIHRLPWSLDDLRTFILSTLRPGTGTWVSGIRGAVAEFCLGDGEEIELDASTVTVTAATARGAISFHLSDAIHALSTRISASLENKSVIVLAVPCGAAAPAPRGLGRIGIDSESIQPENRHEILYDFGLGSAVLNFGIRTSDRDLIRNLNDRAGQSYQAFLSEIGDAILHCSPTRVIRNAIGRIEVFAPIPRPGGRSPSGPHTHFLPKQLNQSGDTPANLHVPDSYLPCFIYYPRNSKSAERH
jgi:predicted Fe-S protein YdhL (DUF1289 family)